jgi:hypothetical protein
LISLSILYLLINISTGGTIMFGLIKKLFGAQPAEKTVEAPYKIETPVAEPTPAPAPVVETAPAVSTPKKKPAPKKQSGAPKQGGKPRGRKPKAKAQ